jgi:hypothetical protein
MPHLIIRLLAHIGFKAAIQQYVYNHQGKSYKSNMEFAFIDSSGRKYYYFPDLKKLPLPLLEKLNELQEQLGCKIPGRDLDAWVAKVEEVLNCKNPKLTDVGYWLGVLKERRSILFEPTVLTEIAALLYIREDENPAAYNQALHKEKFEMLWHDSQKGAKLYDFFQQAGLSSYIPSENITAANWSEYLNLIAEKVKQFNSAVSLISTSAYGYER